jgi:hypothetical protein
MADNVEQKRGVDRGGVEGMLARRRRGPGVSLYIFIGS